MKKISFLLLSIFTLSCSQPKKEPILNPEIEKEAVCNVIDNWHQAASNANFENYFNAMTNSSIFIGTDASENWTYTEFKDFSKPYFDKGKAWSFTSFDRNVYFNSDNSIAWFDELLETWMGICRGSGVAVKENSQWKLQHYVLSLTVPNENINSVIEINKEKDSLFLKKFKLN